MPTYHFQCRGCDERFSTVLRIADRNDPGSCPECGGELERRPEHFAARTFEPYYDEALGCDIHSEAQKKAILAENGWVEAGDPVGGARNFDPNNPGNLDKQPLRGVPYRRRQQTLDDNEVTIVDENGRERTERMGDLETLSTKVDHKAAEAAFKPLP